MLIGVDFGGTKIEAVALSPAGETLARKRLPTPRDDYAASIAAVAGLVADLEAATGARGTSPTACRRQFTISTGRSGIV